MAYQISHDLMRTPPRKMLFLLVVLVVGALTAVSIFLLLKSRDVEQAPQVPLIHPMARLTIPQKTPTLVSFVKRRVAT
jgi:hypothetical protein